MLEGDKPIHMKTNSRWHGLLYGILGLAFAVFLGVVLNNLTSRVQDAEQQVGAANSIASTNNDAVQALAAQVENLGGTPVVNPTDLPTPVPGPAGANGATGAPGASVTGPAGPSGAPGAEGKTGGTGAPGATVTGPAGPSGSPGPSVTGAKGDPGQTVVGPKGDPGETVVGPQGPAGADGKDGKDGADGATGAQGPAGPSCPEGYTQEERTFLTPNSPISGETFLVCAPNSGQPRPSTTLVDRRG